MNEPKDVREMRQRIQIASRGYERMDGSPVRLHQISMTAHLIRAALQAGEHAGWSGEDTMTMLAYYALQQCEQTADQILEFLNTDTRPRILVSAAFMPSAKDSETNDGAEA